jgi:hypothetical protein
MLKLLSCQIFMRPVNQNSNIKNSYIPSAIVFEKRNTGSADALGSRIVGLESDLLACLPYNRLPPPVTFPPLGIATSFLYNK